MKTIIDRKLYDTETSKMLKRTSNSTMGYSFSGLSLCDETYEEIYKGINGYFIYKYVMRQSDLYLYNEDTSSLPFRLYWNITPINEKDAKILIKKKKIIGMNMMI